MVEKNRKGVVEIVLVIVVVAVLAVGGYFIWQVKKEGVLQPPSTSEQGNLQTPDEVSQIEQDLELTDTSQIDADLSSIEAEIDTALSQ